MVIATATGSLGEPAAPRFARGYGRLTPAAAAAHFVRFLWEKQPARSTRSQAAGGAAQLAAGSPSEPVAVAMLVRSRGNARR